VKPIGSTCQRVGGPCCETCDMWTEIYSVAHKRVSACARPIPSPSAALFDIVRMKCISATRLRLRGTGAATTPASGHKTYEYYYRFRHNFHSEARLHLASGLQLPHNSDVVMTGASGDRGRRGMNGPGAAAPARPGAVNVSCGRPGPQLHEHHGAYRNQSHSGTRDHHGRGNDAGTARRRA
jgi:hypothetical protein